MIELERELTLQIIKHMATTTDEERCGLVVESAGIKFYIPCHNSHSFPADNFCISQTEYISASIRGKIIAVCHSHTEKGLEHLSSNDRIYQYRNNLPWILHSYRDGIPAISVWEPIKKLKGREFSEGYLDCYDSFRDFYSLAGKQLPDFSPSEGYRLEGWYNKDGATSTFTDNIEKFGFHKIKSHADMIPGDVIFSLFGAKIANHASVYVGNNMIFHHLPGKLSMVEPLRGFYMKYTDSIWRSDNHKDLNISGVIGLLNED